MAGSDYLIFPQNKTIQRSSLVGWFMTLLENGIVKLGLLTFTAAQAPPLTADELDELEAYTACQVSTYIEEWGGYTVSPHAH